MLQNVVFADRPGLPRVNTYLFATTLATSGVTMDRWNWEAFIKRGVHLQQAMVIVRASTASGANECPFHMCSGVIQRGDGFREW